MVEAKDRECDGADRDDPGLQRRLSGGLDVADTRSPEKHALVEPAKCPGLIAANGDKHLLQQGKEQWTPTTPTDENKKAFSQKRQFLACAAVQTMAVLGGLAIAHSSSLLPALSGPDSEVPITPQQGAWIASSLVLAVPLGSMLGLLLNDVLGRLTLIKIIALPQVLGWVLVATAGSLAQIVGARFILGTALGMSHSFTTLYISEVADKDIRGGLGALGTALASLGILLCYTMGAFLDWRTHAWANCCLPVLPLALLFTLATESPVWLRERGRDEEAARASTFFYDDPTKVLSVAKAGADKKKAKAMGARTWRALFTEPRGYKPFVLIQAVFIIQQLVGIYITIYYAVPLFMETGCTLDPYLASILIGVVRLVGCTSVSWAMRRLGRRPLMLASSAGQAVAMATSGYATARILQGGEVSSMWVVGGILSYIAFGCLGWQVLPWTMMAEVFPHEVRSLAQFINAATANVYIFAVLQLYPTMNDALGGAAGVQYLFAATSALSAVFVWVMLPETRGRTLQEIEEYFENNATFLTERRRKRDRRRQRRDEQEQDADDATRTPLDPA
ncbi:facilitated trehalose transporter Tret1-2 homolog [Frankliniella occidentalis]|uniref:Facilitated trehalose transporter Tret1-2 homolog n=1 Tax=Frankliniella occidentalis TaxID=133901 RepID=A0A9C6XA81_FRAOC|nr:facilitated trehalose transporter Tret1-2 homolog [Frankliniella occidentalis]